MRDRKTASANHRHKESQAPPVVRRFAPAGLDLDALAEAIRVLLGSGTSAQESPAPPAPESTCVPPAEEGVMSWDQEPVLVGT